VRAAVAPVPQQTPETDRNAAEQDPRPLSADTLRRMKAQGAVVATDPSAVPVVGWDEAVRIASRSFGMIASKAPVEGAYGRVTNYQHTRRENPRDRSSSTVRVIEDRPMWLHLYDGVKMPVLGPLETTVPEFNLVDFLIYVDARTGRIPRAETLAPEGADGPGSATPG
jgi:hypothetical protein